MCGFHSLKNTEPDGPSLPSIQLASTITSALRHTIRFFFFPFLYQDVYSPRSTDELMIENKFGSVQSDVHLSELLKYKLVFNH